ncbi:glycoside hydrolase family 76 protein [Kribbella jiaozuonensis]|uniref:Glycosyl hydrolase n=1 Tax=Kribbella jiaozuonensis TaxID=2575441 RepID=A0A4U3LMF6_9ACTN|nr:glycoside hydrolase family 76 protein [Kribbella jiaozuonensis]TKK76948.1 glycosyl hydrolase [Kribbella jiaozuonensis]
MPSRHALLTAVVLLTLPAGTLTAEARVQADQVCSVACDTLDPSNAQEETFPVPEKVINGRHVVLHVSDKDAMAWGSIDGGATNDAVWLDRSWDGGASWDGLLGKAWILSGWTGTRTLMYNLADPAGHRRGLIRACGDAAGVDCTAWVHTSVCAAACDGSEGPSGDNQPVPSTTLANRTISLHLDNRGMAWGTIANGTAGDEIWLDRSWNEGTSWPDGSSLGRTSVGSGATSTSTRLYATTDPLSKLYGGAVRACGRAVEGQNGSCTAWARPGSDRAGAAAEALMYSYQPNTAWWLSSWWNSAVAVTTLMDYQQRTRRTDLRWIVNEVFEKNKGVFPAGQKSGDALEGNFISRAIDDTEWWGIAWVEAYDLTGDQRYLEMAVTIANYVQGYWDTGTCGGGVWWDRERTYKNAVTNGLYIRLTAALHNRLAGDTVWLQRATTGWNWFRASGIINSAGLVNDGLTGSCTNNGQTVWTYNQGLAIGGALELWRATGDSSLLAAARQLGDAAMSSPLLSPGGILTESCDAAGNCDDNQKQFKGVFMRYLMDLADSTGDAPYRTYAQRQADSIWQNDRDSLNRLGQRWAGGGTNVRDWRTQASALGGLLAATSKS